MDASSVVIWRRNAGRYPLFRPSPAPAMAAKRPEQTVRHLVAVVRFQTFSWRRTPKTPKGFESLIRIGAALPLT